VVPGAEFAASALLTPGIRVARQRLMVKGIINIANSVIQQCQNVWIGQLFAMCAKRRNIAGKRMVETK
jgi:hypothetical protein